MYSLFHLKSPYRRLQIAEFNDERLVTNFIYGANHFTFEANGSGCEEKSSDDAVICSKRGVKSSGFGEKSFSLGVIFSITDENILNRGAKSFNIAENNSGIGENIINVGENNFVVDENILKRGAKSFGIGVIFSARGVKSSNDAVNFSKRDVKRFSFEG